LRLILDSAILGSSSIRYTEFLLVRTERKIAELYGRVEGTISRVYYFFPGVRKGDDFFTFNREIDSFDKLFFILRTQYLGNLNNSC